MAKFLKELGNYERAALPIGGAIVGGAVGGPAGAAAGYKAGKTASKLIPGGDSKKGGGFTVPPAQRNFADAGGENAAHASLKYGWPGNE